MSDSKSKSIAKPATAHAVGISPPAQTPSPERRRILLVEGDGFTRLVLLLRLRLAGFAVDFTSNGVLGLGKLRNCHPDILLIDVKLNGLPGVELLKAARSEPGFGDRPIYVFTYVNRMNRGTRKEVESLATKVFDKSSCTREDLVQIFASTFLKKPETAKSARAPEPESPAVPLSEVVPSGAIEELIAGVQEQSELLVKDEAGKPANAAELLSRVSSLASCAKEAGLSNLARQAKALEKFLSQLCKTQQGYTKAALSAVSRAVAVMRGMSFELTGNKQPVSCFTAVFIDEAPYSNRAVEEALLDAGFQPACFEDPAQAKEYLLSNQTDLIIANVVLPEAHGLSLAEIRQLPFHAQTPVIFGPESSSVATVHGDLPTSATRLDKAPVLLRELVVRALNEVQNPGSASATASPSAAAAATASKVSAKAAAALPADDGFNLFAAAPQGEIVAAADSPPTSSTAMVANNAVNRAKAFDELFSAANIPMEPIMRARPSTESADQPLEAVEPLPENPVDAALTEEQAVEAEPLSPFQSQDTEPPQPEAAPEDQATATESIAAPSEMDPPLVNEDSTSGLDTEITSLQVSGEVTPSNGEDMNNRIESASGYVAEPAENGRLSDSGSNQAHQREDLAARVCAAEMALYHAQAQIEQREKDVAALEKQLAEAKAGRNPNGEGPGNDGANPAAQARCAELEAEVAALRQAFEGLNGGFSEQQNGTAETAKQIQELEQRLAQNAAELEKTKTEQQRAEAELKQQVEAAAGASQQTELARKEADARCARLELELEALRKAQAELASQKTQPAVSPSKAGEPWAGASASELEQQVRDGVAALAKATAELAKERGERQRNQQRVAELNGRLQILHDDLSRTLQAQREDLTRLAALEEQHREANQALVRCTADIEEQQAEHRLVQEQLQKAKEANAQLRKDLSFFEDINKKFDGTRQGLHSKLESSLNAAKEAETRLQQEAAERQKLAASLEETRRELQSLSRKRETLEVELQTSQRALQDSEAKLVQETAECQRLAQALDSAQRGAHDGSERDLEFSKVQSALQLEQVERKRQETQLARTRQRALDAAHAARALRTSLRRQVREPVENLINSARSLLELEMGETQKQLAEAVLQDVLLVQTRLREPGVGQGDSHDTTTISKTSST